MQSKTKVSVIIPTLNEENSIGELVDFILSNGDNRLAEVIVCDGNSSDQTVSLAKAAGAKVIENLPRSRAIQMNDG